MNPQTESNPELERLDSLLKRVEHLNDPDARDTLRQIIQGVLEFHAASVTRLIEIALVQSPADFFERAEKDSLVSGLLSLYDLHPLDLPTRIERALDTVRPYLKSHGGNVELLAADNGVVQLRLNGSCHGCPSSMATMKGTIEKAIYSTVPEVTQIEVEGLERESQPAAIPGFVPLTALSSSNGHKIGI